MAEFIRLDEQEQEIPILPDHPHSISNIRPDTKIIDGIIEKEEVDGICADYTVITIDRVNNVNVSEGEEDHICIKDDCDVSKYYGCTGGNDGFQKENLFSELTDEYQRTIARINLGIADEYALKWGNIKGNLSNQKDLYTFVTDSVAFDINRVIDEVNLKLAQWACEVDTRFKNKADIFSPNFSGIPTTTLPLISDNSNRVASTEWVNARIEEASIDDNIRSILLDPEYMCYGDESTDVKIIWDYYRDVDEQSINGIVLDPEVRQYTYSGVTTSMIVTLKYKYGEYSGARSLVFDIKYPTFYGTSSDYTKLEKTTSNSFTISAGPEDYLYVIIPNGYNAVLSVSSIIGGFKLLGTQDIYDNIYYIFKSANKGLGETTVEILNLGNYDSNALDSTSIKELLVTKADKYDTYNKSEVDEKLEAIKVGDVVLNNYYTKTEVNDLIPDISNKADKTEIPNKVSQLDNDSGYLSSIPSEYITESELSEKGYLTEEVEPLFQASAAAAINQSDITSWNNKVDKVSGMGLSEQNFTSEEKVKLKGLTNYNDTQVRQLISDLGDSIDSKADKTEIPDVSSKADKTEIPTRVSQLENDANYISVLPSGIVTEEQLEAKGYLTSFTETDPTVPDWAKQPNKPTYTLDELDAEKRGSASQALSDANNYTDSQLEVLTKNANPNYSTFKGIGDKIEELDNGVTSINADIENVNSELSKKANKDELFSKDYNDLTNLPTIPDITGLATEEYVNTKISEIPSIPDINGKVDKEEGKGLSSNDFTDAYKEKLEGLHNYDDTEILNKISSIEIASTKIPLELYQSGNIISHFGSYDSAKKFVDEVISSPAVVLEYVRNTLSIGYKKTITIDSTTPITSVQVMFHKSYSEDISLVFKYTDTTCIMTTSEIIKIEDSTTSSSTTTALSAAQGKILMERIEALEAIVNDLTSKPSILLE